jgi:hypothetical protein
VTIFFPRWPAVACAFGLCAVLASGCVVAPDAGYGYNPGWPGYYEPYGGVYGGWGPSFLIGPVGGGGYRGGRGGGYGGGQHAFRAAPASHAAPSIPGGRGGGGRGGGGGGHGRR